MKTYTDGRLLFLTDAEFEQFTDVAQIPLIDGWCWNISGAGHGSLTAPDGTEHSKFDLINGTLTFEPDGETITAPGLSASLVQEMGERYAYDVVFNPEEQTAYDEHVRIRENTKKVHDRDIRDKLRGVIQLERAEAPTLKEPSWIAHIDTDKVKELTGIEVEHHAMSVAKGFELFNRMSETLHAAPLRDPSGYMALHGNMYEFIHTEYRNQYENTLQAIDNQMIDGTGYGVASILDTLQTEVRKNVSEYLPKGFRFGDLRFTEATDERKNAVRDFVHCRVSKTLTYEKKRSYEPSAIERTNTKYIEAGRRLSESLSGTNNGIIMGA